MATVEVYRMNSIHNLPAILETLEWRINPQLEVHKEDNLNIEIAKDETSCSPI